MTENILTKKPLKILILGYDWRNIFKNDFSGLMNKFRRDNLNVELNDFFVFSWSTKSYYSKYLNFETVHLRAIFGRLRVIYDFISIFLVPLALKVKKFKPDIVVVNDFQFAFSAIFAKIFFKAKIVLVLGALPTDLAKTRRFWMLKWLYSRFYEIIGKSQIDYSVAIGEATKKYLINLNIKQNKIIVMNPDTISADREFISSVEMGFMRKKHGIAENTKVIFSVGRLQAEKGYEILIKSFNIYKGEDVVLLIAGDGPLKEKLEEIVRVLSLEGQVIFVGHLNRQDLWNYYFSVDAFILLSKSEGLGLAFWEAMYAGVPVVGSRVGGIIDSIGEGQERGYFWSNQDGQVDFKNILDNCLQVTPEVKEKTKRAKEYVVNKISKKININEIYEKYIINS